MKKNVVNLFFIFVLFYTPWLCAQVPSFTYTASSVIQNMVPNSSQQITYTLSTTLPNVIVTCAMNNVSSGLSYSFNNNGCASGGVGVTSSSSVAVNVTLTAASNVTPGSVLTGSLSFQVKPNTGARVVTYTIPVSIQIPSTTNRTITFKNYCPFSVYFGVTSSNVPAKNKQVHACTQNSDCLAVSGNNNPYSMCVSGYCSGGLCNTDADCLNTTGGTCNPNTRSCTYCASNSDCITGASCDTSNNKCYWTLPTPSDAATTHYQLTPYSGSGNPDSDTVTLTDYSQSNGYSLMYGGGFAGRTHCTWNAGDSKLECKTADCNTNGSGDGNGGCELAEGFNSPSTVAEFTLVGATPDTYDSTVINGLNIPLSMYATSIAPATYSNPYTCGNAGGVANQAASGGTIGGCSWSYSPPTENSLAVAYRWVDTDGGANCSSDSDCNPPNTRCGLTENQITANVATHTICGTPLGYWNQNQICAVNSGFNANINGAGVGALVSCSTNADYGNNSIINLLACTTTHPGNGAGTSCYNVGSSGAYCCGCTNWQDQGVTVPTNPNIVTQCQYPNAYWTTGNSAPDGFQGILPYLTWLKQACPSSYVYPYDDKSSTFTCPSNNGQSAVNYTVEFCPGQETAGLPPGP